MFRLLTVSVIAMVVAVPAKAQQIEMKRADNLVRMCDQGGLQSLAKKPAEALEFGFCLGLFNGLIASAVLVQEFKLGRPIFCPAREVTPDQGRKVLLKWMSEHPEDLHENALSQAVVALGKAFPCQQK